MKKITFEKKVLIGFGVLVALIVVLGILGFFHVRELNEKLTVLSSHVLTLENNVASTTETLKGELVATESELKDELNREKQNVANLNQQLGNFESEVGNISSTVTTLEKLSKADPELLQKYSKVFFLNEHYAPERVIEIPNEYNYFENRTYAIHANVWPYLKELLERAGRENIDLFVFSAYRSFDEQEALKGVYTTVYGAGTANQFSADQGYSEHQLGTTADLITTGIGGSLEGFEATEAYQWLKDNAHKYGFILSYPENNTHYVFEPWHWRFVGEDLARELYNSNRNFYDVDQREIDEYLISVFE